MKINKKIITLTALTLCALSLPMCKVFADKLDDDFKAGTKLEYVERVLGVFRHTQTLKFGWASTRKEENGKETYQGPHYLRCYNRDIFGKEWNDTGRVPARNDRGFYLEGGKLDVTDNPIGWGFKASYGNE